MTQSAEFAELLSQLEVEMDRAPQIVQASEFWQKLNRRHRERLQASGLGNFKRTTAKDYFTWMRVLPWDAQIRFLISHLPLSVTLRAIAGTFSPLRHEHIPLAEGLALNFLTRLLWSYVERTEGFSGLAEPEFGNPPIILQDSRLISQDLANSLLEYRAFGEFAKGTVCELGGGYGRNAFVTASLAKVRYIMADIPPAIGIAQEYLTTVFPDRKHFKFRPFTNFDEVRDEFEAADFAYLLPHQLALLPAGSVDLFVNISSLHEMRQAQVNYYLGEIFRLVRPGGHFFLKAWRVSKNPQADFKINAEDYDLSQWEEVFRRTSEVQSYFFETLVRHP